MSDIFREVEEDVRRERLEKLWKRYGSYILVLVLILVLGVAGFQYWRHYQAQQNLNASSAFLQALEQDVSDHPDLAAAQFAQIAKTAPKGYAELAKLAEANALTAAGKQKDALALYQRLMTDADANVADTARVRVAWIQADTAKKADLVKLLAPVNTPKSGWRFMAREILAYVDYRDGNLTAAKDNFARLSKDKNAPETIRQRAEAMASLIATGVGNYGTIPQDEAASAPGAEAAPAADTAKTEAAQTEKGKK